MAESLLRREAERKRAEEALRNSEEKFRTLFEESKDAILITTREGNFIDFNKSTLDLFGYNDDGVEHAEFICSFRRTFKVSAGNRKHPQDVVFFCDAISKN